MRSFRSYLRMSQQLVNTAIATMIDEPETKIGDDADVGEWDRIAEWVRIACTAAGKSQKGLAAAIGIDPAGVNRLAHGKRRLNALELAKAVDYLGTPPDDVKRLLTKLTQHAKTREPKPAPQDHGVEGQNSMMREILYELSGLPSELLPTVLENIRGLKAAYDLGESRHPQKAGKGR